MQKACARNVLLGCLQVGLDELACEATEQMAPACMLGLVSSSDDWGSSADKVTVDITAGLVSGRTAFSWMPQERAQTSSAVIPLWRLPLAS